MKTTEGRAKDKGWLDQPGNVARIFYGLFVVCVLLVAGDFLYHKHVHFHWEGWWGFYGFFGFVSFFCLVLAGKEFRKLVMRDEDYYDG